VGLLLSVLLLLLGSKHIHAATDHAAFYSVLSTCVGVGLACKCGVLSCEQ
jgi:hypothetical protein